MQDGVLLITSSAVTRVGCRTRSHYAYTKTNTLTMEDYIQRIARDYGLSSILCINKGEYVDLQVMSLPEAERGKGTGSEFMKKICNEADRRGKVIGLCPEPLELGSTEEDKARLIAWYKKFGFIVNPDESKYDGVSYIRLPVIQNKDDEKKEEG